MHLSQRYELVLSAVIVAVAFLGISAEDAELPNRIASNTSIQDVLLKNTDTRMDGAADAERKKRRNRDRMAALERQFEIEADGSVIRQQRDGDDVELVSNNMQEDVANQADVQREQEQDRGSVSILNLARGRTLSKGQMLLRFRTHMHSLKTRALSGEDLLVTAIVGIIVVIFALAGFLWLCCCSGDPDRAAEDVSPGASSSRDSYRVAWTGRRSVTYDKPPVEEKRALSADRFDPGAAADEDRRPSGLPGESLKPPDSPASRSPSKGRSRFQAAANSLRNPDTKGEKHIEF